MNIHSNTFEIKLREIHFSNSPYFLSHENGKPFRPVSLDIKYCFYPELAVAQIMDSNSIRSFLGYFGFNVSQ